MGYLPREGDGQRCSQAMNGSDEYSCDNTESSFYHESTSPLSPQERSAAEWMKIWDFPSAIFWQLSFNHMTS